MESLQKVDRPNLKCGLSSFFSDLKSQKNSDLRKSKTIEEE